MSKLNPLTHLAGFISKLPHLENMRIRMLLKTSLFVIVSVGLWTLAEEQLSPVSSTFGWGAATFVLYALLLMFETEHKLMQQLTEIVTCVGLFGMFALVMSFNIPLGIVTVLMLIVLAAMEIESDLRMQIKKLQAGQAS